MGLGFSFAGKDDGLSKTVDKAGDSVNKLFGAMGKVGEAASKFGAVAKQGRQLTSAFEGTLLANKAAGTAIAFNMGVWDKAGQSAVKTGQNISLGIGIGMDEATTAAIEFGRVSEQMKAIGINSAEDLAKSMHVMGMSATDLRVMLTTMGSMGIKSKESIQELSGAFMAAGKSAGDVRGSLAQMGQTLKTLDEVAVRKTGKSLTPEALAKLGKEVAVVSAGFAKLGYGAAESQETASAMFAKLTEDQKAFQNMFSGTADDVPKLAEELAISSGDINTAFKLMQSGPQGFVEGMADMVATAKKNGGDVDKLMTFVGARMEQSLGADMTTKLMKFMKNADGSVRTTMKSVADATEKVGDAQKAYIDPRGLDEKLKIAQDIFETRLREISNKSNEFLNASRRAYSGLGDEIVKLGSDKGPVGDLTRTLADLDHKGLAGLLPKRLQGMGTALGGFGEKIGSTLQGLVSPFGAVKSAISLFAVAMTDAFVNGPKTITEKNELDKMVTRQATFFDRVSMAAAKVGEDFVGYIEALPDKIAIAFDDISKAVNGWFGAKGKQGQSAWTARIKDWWERLSRAWSKVTVSIWPEFKKSINTFWKGLMGAFDFSSADKGADGESAAAKLGTWLRDVWLKAEAWWSTEVWPKISAFGSNLWDGLLHSFDPDKNKKAGDPKNMGTSIGNWLGEAGKVLWAELEIFGRNFWAGLSGAFDPQKNKLGSSGMGEQLGAFLGKAAKTASDWIVDHIPEMTEKLMKALAKGAGNYVKNAVSDVWNTEPTEAEAGEALQRSLGAESAKQAAASRNFYKNVKSNPSPAAQALSSESPLSGSLTSVSEDITTSANANTKALLEQNERLHKDDLEESRKNRKAAMESKLLRTMTNAEFDQADGVTSGVISGYNGQTSAGKTRTTK
jgi:hypothetical protein